MTTSVFPSPPAEERSADVLAIYGGGGSGSGGGGGGLGGGGGSPREGLRTSDGSRVVKAASPRIVQRAAQLPMVGDGGANDRGELPALTMRKITRPLKTAPPLYG